jgi:hypothetical protein
VCNIAFGAGEIVVDTDHLMPLGEKPFTEVRAYKTGSPGD